MVIRANGQMCWGVKILCFQYLKTNYIFCIQIENKLLLPCHHHTSAKFTSKLQNSSLYNKHSRMHKYFVYLRKESVAHGSWPSLELLSYHLVDVLSTLYFNVKEIRSTYIWSLHDFSLITSVSVGKSRVSHTWWRRRIWVKARTGDQPTLPV